MTTASSPPVSAPWWRSPAKKVKVFPGIDAWECSGTPVDCVKLAKHVVLKDRDIPLCVSGINHGSNASINIIYSGTMSAAMEASVEGIVSIGFSLLDIQARVALADHLTRMDQIAQAIEQYREVVKLEPKHADALNNLAWYLREQNPKEALELARLAVTVNPDRAPLLDTLALVESDAGNHQEALRFIKRAVAASPNNPDLLYHQAIIEARSGNKATAIEILRKVLGVDNSAFTEREQAEQLMASLH